MTKMFSRKLANNCKFNFSFLNLYRIFRLELDYDRIQTKLYKNLATRARQILQSIKSLAPNTQVRNFAQI